MTKTQALSLTASGRRAVTFTAFAFESVSYFTFLITFLYAIGSCRDSPFRSRRRRCTACIGRRFRRSRTIVVAYGSCLAQAHPIYLRSPKEKHHET
jgi:hypothetical protein